MILIVIPSCFFIQLTQKQIKNSNTDSKNQEIKDSTVLHEQKFESDGEIKNQEINNSIEQVINDNQDITINKDITEMNEKENEINNSKVKTTDKEINSNQSKSLGNIKTHLELLRIDVNYFKLLFLLLI